MKRRCFIGQGNGGYGNSAAAGRINTDSKMVRKRFIGVAAGIVGLTSLLVSPVPAQETAGDDDPLATGLAAIDAGDLIGAVELGEIVSADPY